MKKSLFLSLMALLVSTLIWSCLQDQPIKGPKLTELSTSELVKNKVASDAVNQQLAAEEIADDRTDKKALQGCNCKFEITNASPADGFGYWGVGLYYDTDPFLDWFGDQQGASHNFYLTATNCFEVEHAGVAPDSGINITWRVTCNGKSVGHTYTIPGGQTVVNDQIQVCLDETCQPYLLLDE